MPAIPQQTVPTPAPVTPRPVLAAAPGGMSTYVDPRIAAAGAPLSSTPTFNFPLPMVAVAGESGQGKSYSYRSMDWERTAVIDTEQKGFPFDHSKIKYYFPCKSHTDVEDAVKRILSAQSSPIRYVIIDSLLMYMDMLMTYSKATYKGYDIYNHYNNTLRAFIKSLKNTRVIFICICAPELVTITDDSGKNTSARRIYTFGRELEGKLEYDFLMVLYATTRKDPKTGAIGYFFQTNTDGICSAKSPPSIYGTDKSLVPNDLSAVVKLLDPTGTATAA